MWPRELVKGSHARGVELRGTHRSRVPGGAGVTRAPARSCADGRLRERGDHQLHRERERQGRAPAPRDRGALAARAPKLDRFARPGGRSGGAFERQRSLCERFARARARSRSQRGARSTSRTTAESSSATVSERRREIVPSTRHRLLDAPAEHADEAVARVLVGVERRCRVRPFARPLNGQAKGDIGLAKSETKRVRWTSVSPFR